jgi:hypothetical protein
MSVSGIMDRNTGTINAMMIPPSILENGQLITGNKYDYSKGIHPQKIAVPAGEDGSFLQADSTMETGLKWVKIAMPTPDEQYKTALEDEVMLQRQQIDALINFLTPQLNSMIEQKNEKMKEERDTKGRSVFFVRQNDVQYTVPYNEKMTVQDVINYIKTTYFIILSPGYTSELKLVFEGNGLDETIEISRTKIQPESTVNIRWMGMPFQHIVNSRIPGKGGKSRRPNKLKKRSKNTKRSKR